MSSFARGEAPIAFMRAKGIAPLLYLAVHARGAAARACARPAGPMSLPQAARKNMGNTLWAIGEALGDDVLRQDGGDAAPGAGRAGRPTCP